MDQPALSTVMDIMMHISDAEILIHRAALSDLKGF